MAPLPYGIFFTNFFAPSYAERPTENGLDVPTCTPGHQVGDGGEGAERLPAVFLASPLGWGSTKGPGGSAREGPEPLIGPPGTHRVFASGLGVVVRSLIARMG